MPTKSVFCIRHGESTFNAAARETGADPLHFDAPLTESGRRQAREARERILRIPFELVVTSPFTRALQTTAELFERHPAAPPVLVEILHREHGASSCDVGRAPRLLAMDFPAFRLDHLPEIWWHAEGEPDERGICVEPLETFLARVEAFRAWLLERPERVIAVVGHGTFFYHLIGRWLDNCEVAQLELGPGALKPPGLVSA